MIRVVEILGGSFEAEPVVDLAAGGQPGKSEVDALALVDAELVVERGGEGERAQVLVADYHTFVSRVVAITQGVPPAGLQQRGEGGELAATAPFVFREQAEISVPCIAGVGCVQVGVAGVAPRAVAPDDGRNGRGIIDGL